MRQALEFTTEILLVSISCVVIYAGMASLIG
jgi:hypothetical protein